jgi:hypothetical protein
MPARVHTYYFRYSPLKQGSWATCLWVSAYGCPHVVLPVLSILSGPPDLCLRLVCSHVAIADAPADAPLTAVGRCLTDKYGHPINYSLDCTKNTSYIIAFNHKDLRQAYIDTIWKITVTTTYYVDYICSKKQDYRGRMPTLIQLQPFWFRLKYLWQTQVIMVLSKATFS